MTTEHPPVPATGSLSRSLPSDQVFERAEATFSILASSIRLHIVWMLGREEMTVSALAEQLGVTTQAISQHLTKLRLSGLVASRRDGRFQWYRVEDPHVINVVQQVVEHHEDLLQRAGGGASSPQL